MQVKEDLSYLDDDNDDESQKKPSSHTAAANGSGSNTAATAAAGTHSNIDSGMGRSTSTFAYDETEYAYVCGGPGGCVASACV